MCPIALQSPICNLNVLFKALAISVSSETDLIAKSLMKLFAVFASILVVSSLAAGSAYPLKLSAGKHHVVDQNNVPVFIHGDSAWFLTEALNGADVDYYLSNRWVQGFNSVIMGLTLQKQDGVLSYEGDIYGQLPFTNTIAGPFTNLLSWNERYFTNVDAVIRRAADYGICVFAYPLYDGFNGQSGYVQMAGNPTNSLYSFGQFIGNRYKNFTNIVWVGAGDYSEPNPPNYLWNWVAAGIGSVDTNHLITAQAARPISAASYYSNFVTLNSTYGSQFPYIESLAAYQRTPVLASFAREPYYEYRNITGTPYDALDCRNFAWWAVLSGDAGHFFGNERQYPFAPGWQAEVWSPGTTSIINVVRLMNTRPWYDCIPDANHTVVTSGYGIWGTGNYVSVTREATGKTVMIYIPRNITTLTVDMTKISGSTANAWWYDPRTGAATNIGSYGTTGTRSFTSPDINDWVLVIDDASLRFPLPGSPVFSLSRPGAVDGADLTNGFRFYLSAQMPTPSAFVIEYATNLVDWLVLKTVFYTNGPVEVLDVGAGNSAVRIYRAVLP